MISPNPWFSSAINSTLLMPAAAAVADADAGAGLVVAAVGTGAEAVPPLVVVEGDRPQPVIASERRRNRTAPSAGRG